MDTVETGGRREAHVTVRVRRPSRPPCRQTTGRGAGVARAVSCDILTGRLVGPPPAAVESGVLIGSGDPPPAVPAPVPPMSWPSIQSEVLEACRAVLEPLGYRLVRSRTSFEKPTAAGRLAVRLLFVASDVGHRSVRVGSGVRHNAIEQSVSMGLPPEKRTTTEWTLSTEWSGPLSLDSPEEQAATVAAVCRYLREVALPFLSREHSLAELSALLNLADDEEAPTARIAKGIRYCQRGLAAARLANDSRYERLRRQYTDHLRGLSRGLYLPEFERCLEYLDQHGPG